MAKPRTPRNPPLHPSQQQLKDIDGQVYELRTSAPTDQSEQFFHQVKVRNLERTQRAERQHLASLRETFLRRGDFGDTRRAYKELPQLFKFRLFKNKPRRIPITDKRGEYIRPIKETILFQNIHADVTYYEGELGDTDRMVYLAILNEAIRHKDFVREFGWVPFTISELADEIGLPKTSHRRYDLVAESLERLNKTALTVFAGFGNKTEWDRKFFLIQELISNERSRVIEDVETRLLKLPAHVPDPHQATREQAKELLGKFDPKTTRLTLIKFNETLMQAINSNEITTIDMWTLRALSRNSARTLFLYLYDASQWRTSQEPLSLTVPELQHLLDIHPVVETKEGKEYIRWTPFFDLINEILREVNDLSKFIDWFSWSGERESAVLYLRLSDSVLQIPPK